MEIYRTVVGNNSPDLTITAKRNSVAIVIDPTATVTLTVVNEHTGDTTHTGTCVLTTPASGIVTYTPLTTSFPSEARYIGTLKIVSPGAKTENIPDRILIIAEAV